MPIPSRLGPVTIDQFKELIWQPEDNYFKSPGPVRIILTDATTGEQTVIVADDAEGQPNGDIIVRGAVRIDRPDGTVTGRSFTYHTETQTGSVLSAVVERPGFSLKGERIDLLPGRVVQATNATFTTCIRGNPDYHITARQIRVGMDRRVKAKNVTFYLGKVRIISLPSLTKNFGRGGGAPFPLPGYSKETGVHLRFHDQALDRMDATLDYNINVSLKRTPEGLVAYEQDAGRTPSSAGPPRSHIVQATQPLRSALETTPPPRLSVLGEPPEATRRTTLYGLVTSNTFVYNRRRTDLQVSRLPEFGVSFRNLTGRTAESARQAHVGDLLNPRLWLVNMEAGLGYLQERPTNGEGVKLGVRADAASPLLPIAGALSVRYGVTGWASVYDRGSAYGMVSPEAELDYLIGRDWLLGATYRLTQDAGSTPFVFDHRDVTHELRARVGYLTGMWGSDLSVNFDLQRGRAYDTIFRVVRRFDCMEVGLSYSARSAGISLVLNLLPPVGAPARQSPAATPPIPPAVP